MNEDTLRNLELLAEAFKPSSIDMRLTPDTVLALIAEIRSLRAKLDAVPVAALLFWLDPFASGALTADAVADAGAKIDAWAQSVRQAVTV